MRRRRIVTATVVGAAPVAPTRDRGLRLDVQALRALAVLAVLLYHLWPNRLTGGYVGVDVFFVISGFLITTSLVREVERTGRIGLTGFWTRRAKRLLPASLLVLAASIVGTILWVPRNDWTQFLGESIAATFYLENWYLAWSSVDYLGAENDPSPVQHFWTLSVEEQFYIALPVLLIAVLLLCRALRMRFRPTAYAVLALLAAASFVHGIEATQSSAASAYFSTLTRGWEFLIGALVAALPAIRSSIAGNVVALTGVGGIVAAVILFDHGTAMPGTAALLPVLGTAAVISGAGGIIARVGSLAPVAAIGRYSYAMYLWHWPLIVLSPAASGHPLTTVEKLVIIAATLLLGWASTVLVEEPIRFSPRLLGRARPRRIAALATAAMVVVGLLAGGALAVSDRVDRDSAAVADQLLEDPPDCFGAATLGDPACADADLGELLVPDPAALAGYDANRAECWSGGGDATLRFCTLGDADAPVHLLAIGDSHNNSLIGAYEELAELNDWRIDVAGRAGCYWTGADLRAGTEALTAECAEWRAAVDDLVAQPGLDAILVTKARIAPGVTVAPRADESPEEALVDGLIAAWDGRPDPAVPIVALVDNPAMPDGALDCVREHGAAAATACAVPAADALPLDGQERAAELAENAHAIDLTDLFCSDLCAPVVGGAIVYNDDGRHVTDVYARTLVPYLSERVGDVIS